MMFGFVMLLMAGLCQVSFGLGYKKMLPFHGWCSGVYLNIVKSPNREGLDSCFSLPDVCTIFSLILHSSDYKFNINKYL